MKMLEMRSKVLLFELEVPKFHKGSPSTIEFKFIDGEYMYMPRSYTQFLGRSRFTVEELTTILSKLKSVNKEVSK